MALSNVQRAQIRRLWQLGWTAQRIATHLGIGRETVDRHKERRTGRVGRCPKCGGKVVLPCHECGIREMKLAGKVMQNG